MVDKLYIVKFVEDKVMVNEFGFKIPLPSMSKFDIDVNEVLLASETFPELDIVILVGEYDPVPDIEVIVSKFIFVGFTIPLFTNEGHLTIRLDADPLIVPLFVKVLFACIKYPPLKTFSTAPTSTVTVPLNFAI